eukprot:scaffold23960_cov42-Attheya_sp.AAC.2
MNYVAVRYVTSDMLRLKIHSDASYLLSEPKAHSQQAGGHYFLSIYPIDPTKPPSANYLPTIVPLSLDHIITTTNK